MKIVILKNTKIRYEDEAISVIVGDVGEVDDAQGRQLVRMGRAKELTNKQFAAAVKKAGAAASAGSHGEGGQDEGGQDEGDQDEAAGD